MEDEKRKQIDKLVVEELMLESGKENILHNNKVSVVNQQEKNPVNEPSLPSFKYDDTKTIDQNANDLIELKASERASQDKLFVDEVAETKKETIKESARVNKDIHLIKKDAEKITALTEKDRAFYEQWKPILEWGGIKDPVTRKLAIFLIILIMPFYVTVTIGITLPIAIIKTLFKSINILLEEIKTFGKIARSIAFTILILGTISLIAFIIVYNLQKYGIINVF